MKRFPLLATGLVALAVLGILSGIITQGFQELARAEEEHRRYSEEKAGLEHRISELNATLEALDSDPRAVESMARQDLGWVKPGERVILIATPTPLPAPPEEPGPQATPLLTLK